MGTRRVPRCPAGGSRARRPWSDGVVQAGLARSRFLMPSDPVTCTASSSRDLSPHPLIRHKTRWTVDAATAPNQRRSPRDERELPRTLQSCLSRHSPDATQAAGQAGRPPLSGILQPESRQGAAHRRQQQLATRYLPLARSMAARLAGDWSCVREEFEAAACLALVEAAQAFDLERKLDFVTYARPHILGALYDLRRELFVSGCRIRRAGCPVARIRSARQGRRRTPPDRPHRAGIAVPGRCRFARPDRGMDQEPPLETRRGHPADLHRRPVPASDRRAVRVLALAHEPPASGGARHAHRGARKALRSPERANPEDQRGPVRHLDGLAPGPFADVSIAFDFAAIRPPGRRPATDRRVPR